VELVGDARNRTEVSFAAAAEERHAADHLDLRILAKPHGWRVYKRPDELLLGLFASM
jgi:hypothetical protein